MRGQKKYPLNKYEKASKRLASEKGLRVESFNGKGSAVRFELYDEKDNLLDFWVVHTEHKRTRLIWSKEDYRKPEKHIPSRSGEFMEILESL